MVKRIGAWILGVVLGVGALAQGGDQAWVQVYAEGQLVAQGGLHQILPPRPLGQAEARLWLEGEVYTFALAQAGKTLGETRVWLNGRTEALAKVAAEIWAALRGEKDLAVFWAGQRVVGLVEVNPQARVHATGATHVTLILGGQERTLEVHHAGAVLVEVAVKVDGRVRSLVEVALAASSSQAGAGDQTGGAGEVRGRGGVSIGIGLGLGR
ncbi:hypothetical protein [Thermus thermamylovorans]|uniref:Uncharacterized protein n=1 Tax=Thermus thermamylovorans TaxID=2509362 RepID=A0A4Q9B530_9DEIN|nr:hypothetical protein [Thermus thermamylovorans]TBH21069.1 hypothetical protein ETP66_04660 [Thermus thermamylovorans]